MLRALLLALGLSALAACGGSDANDGGACGGDAKSDVYAPGLTKTADTLAVKIAEADPAPPAMGKNTMTFELAESAAPVEGATFTVTPFMPAHGHGSGLDPVVTALGGGRYRVADLYFMMPGTWTITVRVERPGVPAREVVFALCLER